MTAAFDLVDWLADRTAPIDSVLRARFGSVWPSSFREPLHYPLFTGGKRFRPALCLAACEGVGAAAVNAVPAAVALELVHSYSLVHDDLPAMDDDEVRRGQPTVHKRFGEATAILVGDALLTEAFAVLAEAPLPPEVRVALVGRLARSAGAEGMVGGQVADIAAANGRLPVTEAPTLEHVHALKTGALLTASAVMGGLSGEAFGDQISILEHYGRAVGLAFQLADDLLDFDEADPAPSYVRLLGRDETLRRARVLAQEASSLARELPEPAALIALARFTVERDV